MTAIAIVLALIFAILLYYIYFFLFSFLVGFVSRYDQRLGAGLVGIVVQLLLPYGLAFFGGTLLARRIISSADPVGLRYGVLATATVVSLVAFTRAIALSYEVEAVITATVWVVSAIGTIAGTSDKVR